MDDGHSNRETCGTEEDLKPRPALLVDMYSGVEIKVSYSVNEKDKVRQGNVQDDDGEGDINVETMRLLLLVTRERFQKTSKRRYDTAEKRRCRKRLEKTMLCAHRRPCLDVLMTLRNS